MWTKDHANIGIQKILLHVSGVENAKKKKKESANIIIQIVKLDVNINEIVKM